MTIADAEALARLRDQGLDFVTRDGWGAQEETTYQWRRVNRHVDLPVRRGFWHISVTRCPERGDTADEAAVMREVEAIGQARFSTGISYNGGVTQSGRLYLGQPLDAAGAHTLDDKGTFGPVGFNWNYAAHALVLPQNIADEVTDAQLETTAGFFAACKRAGLNTLDTINGHREVAWKECPGNLAWARIEDLNDLFHTYVRNGLPTGDDDVTEKDKEDIADAVVKRLLGQDLQPKDDRSDRSLRGVLNRLANYLEKQKG